MRSTVACFLFILAFSHMHTTDARTALRAAHLPGLRHQLPGKDGISKEMNAFFGDRHQASQDTEDVGAATERKKAKESAKLEVQSIKELATSIKEAAVESKNKLATSVGKATHQSKEVKKGPDDWSRLAAKRQQVDEEIARATALKKKADAHKAQLEADEENVLSEADKVEAEDQSVHDAITKAISGKDEIDAELKSASNLKDGHLFDPITDKVKKATETAEKAVGETVDAADEAVSQRLRAEAAYRILKDAIDQDTQREMMSGINIMRAKMCTTRPNIFLHVKCMKFMTKQCQTETTKKGHCRKYLELLADGCDEHEQDSDETKEACAWLRSVIDPEKIDDDAIAPQPEEKVLEDANDAASEDDEEASEVEDLGTATDKTDNTTVEELPVAEPAPAKTLGSGALNLDKKHKDLPEQGYDDFGHPMVPPYKDGEHHTSDWRAEWPRADESKRKSILKICNKMNAPSHWCRLYLKKHGTAAAPATTSSTSWFDFFR